MKLFLSKIFFSLITIKTLYYNTTYIEKDIIIKNKYIRNSYKNDYIYMISDTNNNIYSTNNQWWNLKFNKAELWNNLDINKKYKIQLYGIRFHYLDIYPNIINIQ